MTEEPTASPTPLEPLANPSSLEDSAFHMAMAHFYRAEMNRMTVWRSRLDTTSNWAILLTTGMTTFALGSTAIPHYLLLLGVALIAICLFIEARRYRHLHHSKWRLQIMERNYFGEALCPGMASESYDWRRLLALDMRQQHYTISWTMAVRLRLRRNYLMLVFFIMGVWLAKVFIHPSAVRSADEFYRRLVVPGLFPSWFVAATAVLALGLATVIVLLTPSEEALENWTYQKHFERL